MFNIGSESTDESSWEGAMKSKGLGISYQKSGKFVYLSGYIDEFSDYAPLLAMGPPLRLNLRHITALNSLGIRKWILFIKSLGVSLVEFYECSPQFIDTVNMLPDMVSPTGNMKRIKSIVIPYECSKCQKSQELIAVMEKMAKNLEDITLGPTPCPHCESASYPQVTVEDHFLFLDCG